MRLLLTSEPLAYITTGNSIAWNAIPRTITDALKVGSKVTA